MRYRLQKYKKNSKSAMIDEFLLFFDEFCAFLFLYLYYLCRR